MADRPPRAVLFACGQNAIRSPMAAALARQMFGPLLKVGSAGVRKGELDGFAWRDAQFRELQNRVVGAVLRTLAATPGWRVRTGNRGIASTDEVLVHVDLDVDSEAHVR